MFFLLYLQHHAISSFRRVVIFEWASQKDVMCECRKEPVGYSCVGISAEEISRLKAPWEKYFSSDL